MSSIGAMVTITLDDGRLIHKPYVSGEGLASDSSRVIIAGLGAQKATRVDVTFIGRPPHQVTGSYRNETITIPGSE